MFNNVVQKKAYVKVDENGTEASAVTQIGGLTALPPQYFVLDRPFIFFIREKSTGVIIFSGVIRNICPLRPRNFKERTLKIRLSLPAGNGTRKRLVPGCRPAGRTVLGLACQTHGGG